MGTPHSSKLRQYWSFTIRMFSVISRSLVGIVFLLSRDALSVFCCPSWVAHWTLIGGVLPLCRDPVGIFPLLGEVLTLCRDAVSVFYSPSQLGHRALVGVVLLLCRDTIGVFCNPADWVSKKISYNTFENENTYKLFTQKSCMKTF